MRCLTAGESHGKALICYIDNFPAGVKISSEQIANELEARRVGIGRGERQKFEQDEFEILSGVLNQTTTAAPITVMIKNSEWEKWKPLLDPNSVWENESSESSDFEDPNLPENKNLRNLSAPRPGHADLEGIRKYGFSSSREVLERSSARETAARVVGGAFAKAFLQQFNQIEISSNVIEFGGVNNFEKFEEIAVKAKEDFETVGGIVELRVKNLPFGLGSYTSSFEKLDSLIAQELMSIQAVKGVEIGLGFNYSKTSGSNSHDEICLNEAGELTRKTNNAGGIEGGVSNGEELIIKFVVKPIPTLPNGLKTVDLKTLNPAVGHSQRSDVSAVFPAAKVGENALATVLVTAIQKKFGSDSLSEIKRNYLSFLEFSKTRFNK